MYITLQECILYNNLATFKKNAFLTVLRSLMLPNKTENLADKKSEQDLDFAVRKQLLLKRTVFFGYMYEFFGYMLPLELFLVNLT